MSSESGEPAISLTWDGLSPEMKELMLQRAQLKSYINLTNKKITELETSYLEEPNTIGNLVRGWDLEGRAHPSRRGGIDDRDRLFSSSSYPVWLNMRAQQEELADRRAGLVRSESSRGGAGGAGGASSQAAGSAAGMRAGGRGRRFKRGNNSNQPLEDMDAFDY